MADCMAFPKTADEFIEQYKFTDTKQEYTNGAELIPVFRVKQMLEHYVAEGNHVPGKWIPVTERMPRYNEEVLVYRPKMAMKIYVSSYEGYYGEDDDEWHEGWGICGDITHWTPVLLPLPQPPKGE